MSITDRITLAWYILTGVPVIGEGETTSRPIASIASRGLRNPYSLTAKEIRAMAASCLTQYAGRK